MNALFSLGSNAITSTTDDTTANWGALGPGYSFYSTAGLLVDQPQQYGFVLNFPSGRSAEVCQLWRSQPNGDLYHRGGNNDNWSGSWRKCLDSSNYSNYTTFTKTVSAPSLLLSGDITYANGSYTDKTMIQFKSGDDNGAGILIGGGGYIGIGAGESAGAVFDAISATGGNESVHISSDNAITFYTNCQTIANRITTTIDTSGNVSAISFTARSDKRLKENIESYTCPNSILDLDVKKFDFINGAKNQIGCIAQELQEICPELIKEDENGYLSIYESKLVYPLLLKVKEQEKRLKALELMLKYRDGED